jgi:hypothetical protein
LTARIAAGNVQTRNWCSLYGPDPQRPVRVAASVAGPAEYGMTRLLYCAFMFDFLTLALADYELIDCGNFQKLERFGKYVLAGD